MPTATTTATAQHTPFLKWAGGKRWLADAIVRLVGADAKRTYIEPFLGSGAVFFALRPTKAHLGDVNASLINAFRVVGRDPAELIRRLSDLAVRKDVFDRIKTAVGGDRIDRAARFIYLNRTGFNGLYRVNQKGEFNVPFGCKPETKSCDPASIKACAPLIRRSWLHAGDFRTTLSMADTESSVYLDPPYTVAHNQNGFVRYNESLFSWRDQQDLAKWANGFASDGGRVLISNAAAPAVRKLYDAKSFTLAVVERKSRIAAEIRHRSVRSEFLLISRGLASSTDVRHELLAAGVSVVRVFKPRQ